MAPSHPAPKPAEVPSRPADGSPALAPAPPRIRMSWPRRVTALLFVLAVAAVVAASLRPRPEPPLAVQLTTARKGPITRIVTGAGKLQAATEVKLSSNITGDLLELRVKEGDRVVKGQVLGRIDARRYAAQVQQQEAARASAAADRHQLAVQVAQLEQDLGRAEKLAATGNASPA